MSEITHSHEHNESDGNHSDILATGNVRINTSKNPAHDTVSDCGAEAMDKLAHDNGLKVKDSNLSVKKSLSLWYGINETKGDESTSTTQEFEETAEDDNYVPLTEDLKQALNEYASDCTKKASKRRRQLEDEGRGFEESTDREFQWIHSELIRAIELQMKLEEYVRGGSQDSDTAAEINYLLGQLYIDPIELLYEAGNPELDENHPANSDTALADAELPTVTHGRSSPLKRNRPSTESWLSLPSEDEYFMDFDSSTNNYSNMEVADDMSSSATLQADSRALASANREANDNASSPIVMAHLSSVGSINVNKGEVKAKGLDIAY